MLIITLRTDKPEAEVGLYENERQLAYVVWTAHHQLAETLHTKIKEMLDSQNKSFDDIEGIVVFAGPGSFTGLRIGVTVANTLAYALNIPIAGRTEPTWLEGGIADLLAGKAGRQATVSYGSDPHITAPKH
jgi:tRNA threonylcarbamoyladenosine biosynthesis protein TsaB